MKQKLMTATQLERRSGLLAAERRTLVYMGVLQPVSESPRLIIFDEENCRRAEEWVRARNAARTDRHTKA